MKEVEVGLSLGGNLGEVKKTIFLAQQQIAALPQVRAVRHSPLYRTAPLSPLPQPHYLNAATVLKTTLTPFQLLTALQQIEQDLGKTPKSKEAPRPIDIDLIFFGAAIVTTPSLQLPHPRWQTRLFVVAPLSDLIAEVPSSKGGTNLSTLRKSLAAQSCGVVQLESWI